MTATVTPDAGASSPNQPTPAPVRVSHTFAGGLAAIGVLGLVVRVLNVLWWRPTTEKAGYHGYKLGGDAYLLPLAGQRAGEGRVVRRSGAVGARRGRSARAPATPRSTPSTSRCGRRSGSTASPPTGSRRRCSGSRRSSSSACSCAGIARRRRRPDRGRDRRALPRDLDQRRHVAVGDDGDLHDRGDAARGVHVLAVAAHAQRRPPRAGVRRHRAHPHRAAPPLPHRRHPARAASVRDADWRRRIRLAIVACVMGAARDRPWVVFNLTRFKETTTITQRHRRGVVGRELRRGVLRQVAHRLLRELLPGTVAGAGAGRVATRRRAAEAGRSSTPRPTSTGCRWSSPPGSDACGGCSSPGRRPRSTGGSRGAGGPPRGSACSPTTRSGRSRSTAWSSCGADAIPILPLVALAVDRHPRRRHHLRRHALPGAGRGRARGRGRDRHRRGVGALAKTATRRLEPAP